MTRKHKLALVSAVVLGLAGAGAAFASGGGRDHGPASASVGRTSLTARWGGGAQGFLGARGFGLGFGFGFGWLGGGLQTASDYLGVSVSTLMGDLRSGKSLADSAGATSGKSESGLVDALVAKAKSQLEKAMSAGKLSQDQVTKLEANLQDGVKKLVEAKRPAPSAAPSVPKPGFGLGFGFGWLGGGLQTASDYLGVSVSTLMGDLRSGKSLADVAGATSGKSESGLVDALVAKAKSQLEKAMSAGKLSQDQVTKLEANLQDGVKKLVEAKRPAPSAAPSVPKPGFGLGFGFGWLGGGLQTASDYLGVSVSTLMGDLRSGKSLADVAGATSGKSESGLVDALVAKAKSQLEKAMSAGKLSQDQVTKLEANLQDGVKKLVEAKRPKPQPGSGKRGFGRGFGFGFGFGFVPHGWGIRPSGGANP